MKYAAQWLVLVVAACPLGCATYSPRPLEPRAAHELWRARGADSPEVAEFVRRLQAQGRAAPATFDPADGLTLAEAELIALFYNPSLRLARVRAGITRATARFAGLWADPELSIGAERVIESVEHPWVVAGALDLTLPVSGRLGAEKARAQAEHAADIARIAEQEWDVRSRLRRAWVEWSAALEGVGVAGDALAGAERLALVVERLESAGEVGRLDARAFRMEAAMRSAELAAARARAAELELLIRGLMGLSPAAPLGLEPLVVYTPVEPGGTGVEELPGRSPALAVLGAEYEAAERALKREVRAQYPDLTIGPGLGRDEGDDRVTLGLSLALPLWNRNQGSVASALAGRDAARAAYEARLEELSIELTQARAAAEAARLRRESIESTLIPLAIEQERDARRVADLGEVNTTLVLDTLTRVAAAKEQLIQARVAESLARIDIEALLGPPSTTPEPATNPLPDGAHP